MGQTLLEREDALEEVLDWEAGLQALHGCIALRFSRSESRQRVLAYPCLHRGRLCKDCWGRWSARMDGVGRIRWRRHARWGAAVAGGVHWDADQVRDDLQGYVVEHLGDPGGVLVVDETGFLKQGKKSVGVKRQYSGTAGKVENCQIGVFLAYGSRRGRPFWTGSSTYPRNGRRTGRGGGKPVCRKGWGGLPHQSTTGPGDD